MRIEEADRREAMAVLAKAPVGRIRELWQAAGIADASETLRGPETGLVTVRGRIGGGGASFNVGEATVTRATVRLASGEVGHAYALGRDGEKARLCATVDAVFQKPGAAGVIEERVLAPLRTMQEEDDRRRSCETAATKVDFFTVARGED